MNKQSFSFSWAYLNTPIINGDIWTIVNSNMDSYHILWASSRHFSMWVILESYSPSQIDGYSIISIIPMVFFAIIGLIVRIKKKKELL